MYNYKFKDKIYASLSELRKAMPNITFSQNVSEELLHELGVEIIPLEIKEPPKPSLEYIKDRKIRDISMSLKACLNVANRYYSEAQVSTFQTQVEEAKKILDGYDGDTTNFYISQFAKAEGTDIKEYASRVIAHNDRYRKFMTFNIGLEREAFKRIENATTEEEVNSVTVTFAPLEGYYD